MNRRVRPLVGRSSGSMLSGVSAEDHTGTASRREGTKHRARCATRNSATCLTLMLLLFLALPLGAQEPALTIDGGELLTVTSFPVTISGTATPQDARVAVSLRARTLETRAVDGRWQLTWPETIPTGTHTVEVAIIDGPAVLATATTLLRIDQRSVLPRRPYDVEPTVATARRPVLRPEDYQAFTDRWQIVPPTEYDLLENSKHPLDPYHQNILKGDKPIIGQDVFLSLTGISDTLFEGRDVPTPSSVSADDPGSIDFFGEGDQGFVNQNVVLSADLFRGQTAFKPADWRARVTLVGNFNHLEVRENAAVSPDVRRGTDRSDGHLGLQELFFEKKIADLSPNYDFVSARIGVQQFVSDFRGFIFNDFNLGARLFGNAHSNRIQYNLAYFDRLEKDTNSGLNIYDERREQTVAIANLYVQDFIVRGYTAEASVHYLRDDPTLFYDVNGFLVRPDPVGDFKPHEIEATYLGFAGFGHFGRWNVDHAFYYVFGEDSLNPIAGVDPIGGGVGTGGAGRGREAVDISAGMAALELSYDRDWYRPKIGYFWSSGDDDVFDRDANGFAAIFANPNFAGGGFSFWNRLGIRLAGTGVGLVHRGSLLPDLNSSKDEGQPNFVNPGLHLATAGLDVELTTRTKLILTANHLRFDETEVLEGVLFQDRVGSEIGLDLSVGARHRPFLSNNVVVLLGAAAFLPGRGFEDIYEDDSMLFQLFTNLTLTF